jgi:opacity protein-like surface antigen
MKNVATRAIGVGLALAAAMHPVLGQDADDTGVELAAPSEKLSIYGIVAAVEGDDPPVLTGDGPDSALGLGVGQVFNRYVSADAELLITLGEYETPPDFAFTDDDMTLTGGFLLYSVKLHYPFGRFRPYFGAGLGVAYHELEVTGSFGLGHVRVEDDFGIANQLLAGFDLRVGDKTRIGFGIRELDVDADFRSTIGGEIDVGGRMWTFTFRRTVTWARRPG